MDITKCEHALERECLRVDGKGRLSVAPHPVELGSPLTHPWISTDFAEAQLELRTPPFLRIERAGGFLRELQQYADGLVWPYSLPGELPKEIPIAQYGSSNEGKERFAYRQGLSTRYGRPMQTVSGIHYNFSLMPDQWGTRDRTEGYFDLARNFLRWGWLNTYLFGASPVADVTYPATGLKKLDATTRYLPYATSLRMGPVGYYSKVQAQLAISYNSVEEYVRDLRWAVSTPSEEWAKFGDQQMNDHYLQIEAEHYSRIRPKPRAIQGLTPLEVLEKEGVTYIEVRSVDLNPFVPEGVELDQMRFLHLFLAYCLQKKSSPLGKNEQMRITDNQELVALEGRRPGLALRDGSRSRPLREWALAMLDEMAPLAAELGYARPLERQKEKVLDPTVTPSARVLKEVRGVGLRAWGLKLAKQHVKDLGPPSEKVVHRLQQVGAASLEKQKAIERQDDFILKGYEDFELSSQMVIREALARNVTVEVLDRKDQFLRLTKGKRSVLIHKATISELDPMVSYFAMDNKSVTKQLLGEAGFSVPSGPLFDTLESAIDGYRALSDHKVVVKPNCANYGVGITFVEPGAKSHYVEAVTAAFEYSDSVLVETFCEGEEFRLLVIGDHVRSICQRIPANVVGDGKHSIAQLVRIKNRDPAAYKLKKYRIKLGQEEKRMLAAQRLKPTSVPAAGKQIFLRENSNVSTGGDPLEVSHRVHPDYHAIAIRAAKTLSARFCGVDLMLKHPGKKPTKSNHVIIELNYNPAIFLHRYPVEGEPTYPERYIMDELGLT